MFLDKEHKVSSKKKKVYKKHVIDTSTEIWMSVIVKDKEYFIYIYIYIYHILWNLAAETSIHICKRTTFARELPQFGENWSSTWKVKL